MLNRPLLLALCLPFSLLLCPSRLQARTTIKLRLRVTLPATSAKRPGWLRRMALRVGFRRAISRLLRRIFAKDPRLQKDAKERIRAKFVAGARRWVYGYRVLSEFQSKGLYTLHLEVWFDRVILSRALQAEGVTLGG